jgi:hypothetical protein
VTHELAHVVLEHSRGLPSVLAVAACGTSHSSLDRRTVFATHWHPPTTANELMPRKLGARDYSQGYGASLITWNLEYAWPIIKIIYYP